MAGSIEISMFQAIRPHYKRIAKFIFIDTSLPINRDILLYNLPRVGVWIVLIIYNAQHLIKVIQSRHDSDAMINTLCMFLTTFIALIKQLDLIMRKKRMLKLFDTTKGELFSPKNKHQAEIVTENEKSMNRLQNMYLVAVTAACTLQGVYPLVNRARGQDVELIIYFPVDIRSSPIFEIAVVYCAGMLMLQGYINLMLDCTVATLYSQTRVQLTLLRDNLLNLVDLDEDKGLKPLQDKTDTSASKHSRDAPEAKIRRRLVHCILHHREIFWFLKEVESVTAIALTAQFFGTAWIICMTVYRIVGLTFLSTEFWSMFVYLTCMLWQLFMYSYYGTQVKVESEFVCESAYRSRWLVMSPGLRRQLLIFMTISSAKPITPYVAKIVPITMQTYISVLRASYTLFTVLDKK